MADSKENWGIHLGCVYVATKSNVELGELGQSVALAIDIAESDDPDDPNIVFLILDPTSYEPAKNFLKNWKVVPFWVNKKDISHTGEIDEDGFISILTYGEETGQKAGPFNIYNDRDAKNYLLSLTPDNLALLVIGQYQLPRSQVQYLLGEGFLTAVKVDPEWLIRHPPESLYEDIVEKILYQQTLEQFEKLNPEEPKPQF